MYSYLFVVRAFINQSPPTETHRVLTPLHSCPILCFVSAAMHLLSVLRADLLHSFCVGFLPLRAVLQGLGLTLGNTSTAVLCLLNLCYILFL